MIGFLSSRLKRMHPVYKLLVCAGISLLALLVVSFIDMDTLSRIMICWNAFSLTMLIIDWHIFFNTEVEQIHTLANREDEGRVAIFIFVLVSTFASMLAITLLLISGNGGGEDKALHVVIALLGMMLSWVLVHTLFGIRYAHLYYGDDKNKKPVGGLDFPGKDDPDFIDFAYFSFVLGMTFQVSDVVITSKTMRRNALLHGLISFGYNTVIVALSINTIAGLSSK